MHKELLIEFQIIVDNHEHLCYTGEPRWRKIAFGANLLQRCRLDTRDPPCRIL